MADRRFSDSSTGMLMGLEFEEEYNPPGRRTRGGSAPAPSAAPPAPRVQVTTNPTAEESKQQHNDDAQSLSYSRASAYFSESSADHLPEDFEDSYYHPAFPTPAENEAPPVPVPSDGDQQNKQQGQQQQKSEFSNFINSPMEYIFGGNDDEVSVDFHDSHQWDTPPGTLNRQSMNVQPTIYEEDEEASFQHHQQQDQQRQPHQTTDPSDYSSDTFQREQQQDSAGLRSRPKSWRSHQDQQQKEFDRRTAWHKQQSVNRSQSAFLSRRSVLPETPEVIRDGDTGPVMTRGMSGKAVVHISMIHGKDGDINKVEYTKPLVEPQKENELFLDEPKHSEQTKSHWHEYYVRESNFVRQCHSKQCYRITALSFVIIALLCTVAVAVYATVKEPKTNTQVDTEEGPKIVSLSDLTPPPFVANTRIPHILETRVQPWFHVAGHYAAKDDDVPFFFHIPMAGATIVTESWSNCLGFTLACDVGGIEVQNSTVLKSIQVYGASYVNVNVATPTGVTHAASLGLIASSIPDVVFSPLFGEVITQLYSEARPAKLVVMMRNPIDRTVALFYYMKTATWDPKYHPDLVDMTLEEYALSHHIENNYVTRLLTGKSGGPLQANDLNVAKEILRTRAIVGLYESLEASVEHVERYFAWTPQQDRTRQCQERAIRDGLLKNSPPETLDAGSTAHALIAHQNTFDIQLYNYVKTFLVPYQLEVVSRQMVGKSADFSAFS